MFKSIFNDIIIAQCQIRVLIKMISNAACRELSIIKSIFNGIGVMIAQCQVIIQWGSNRHHRSVSVWKIPKINLDLSQLKNHILFSRHAIVSHLSVSCFPLFNLCLHVSISRSKSWLIIITLHDQTVYQSSINQSGS